MIGSWRALCSAFRGEVAKRFMSFASLVWTVIESGKAVAKNALVVCAAERRSRTDICTVDCGGQEWEALLAVFQHNGA